ncbi:MAG: AMIN domain-containing protein [Desulforhopalus sp.]
MLKWLDKIKPAVFCAFCILIAFQTSTAWSETGVKFEIADISVTFSDDSLLYTIKGTSPPAYTTAERFSPFRVVVDVAGGFLAEGVDADKAQIPENSIASVKLQDLKDNDPQVMRFEFSLADSHDYSVEQKDNSLEIRLFPASNTKDAAQASNVSEGGVALTDFKISSTPNSTTITIVSSGPITNYTVDTIGSGVNRPPRMFIDVEDVNISELVREKNIGTSVDQVRVAPKGNGARIVFDSSTPDIFKYSVTPSAEGLNVVIDESQLLGVSGAEDSAGTKAKAGDDTLDQLISSSEQLIIKDSAEGTEDPVASKAAKLEDDFSFSGYKKQRISVDFYKIDIHNVFRLFRQISDLNIIVDESVKGSLTLALDDVPWDFALDIIINLMNLEKEERFNTLVIYPAKKDFAWPTRAEDNLEFEADIEVIEQEALIFEKTATQSKEIMQAKEYMVKAQSLESRDEIEDAALLYEKALELWPDNIKISNRLAALYLVNLGMNAKAVFYAKESLKRDPQNTNAALYAAIGSAKMQRLSEAKEYFTQSISNSPPMKEALLSYASFSENNGQNDAAIKLLDKYHSYHGETVDTMIAKARIFDKLGLEKDANQQYLALLSSGFQLRPDLKQYIHGRLAAKDIK